MTKSRYEGKNGREFHQLIESDLEIMKQVRLADIGRLEMMLNENRDLIIDVGEMLNKSQPPNTGKIEVRFWKSPRVENSFEPVVVEWKKGKVTRIPPKMLVQRAKSYGGFARNHQETRELLRYLTALFDNRRKLLWLISNVRRTIASYERHGYQFEKELKLHDILSDLGMRISKNNAYAAEHMEKI